MFYSNMYDYNKIKTNKTRKIVLIIVLVFVVFIAIYGIIKVYDLSKNKNILAIDKIISDAARKYMSNNGIELDYGESLYLSFNEINYQFDTEDCSNDGGVVINNYDNNLTFTPYYTCNNKISFSIEQIKKQNSYCADYFVVKGDNPVILTVGQKYIEQGYIEKKSVSKVDIENNITNNPGIYYVDYKGTFGGKECIVTRVVIIKSNIDINQGVPSLNLDLLGEETKYILKGDTYTEPGYTATDKNEGDLTSKVRVIGNVNTNIEGNYALIYNITNKQGESITKYRNIIVEGPNSKDNILKLKGSKTIKVIENTEYIDPGYTAIDSKLGDITSSVKIEGTVDISAIGSYTITYSVTNSKGITERQARTIIVINDTRSTNVQVKKDITKQTSGNVTLTLTMNGGYSYIILPNGNKAVGNPITYQVSINGSYKFNVYNNDGTSRITTVTVSNIDRDPPTGTCQINGNKIYVSATDKSGISGYNYNINGVNSGYITSSTYQASSNIESSFVSIKDNVNNEDTINCSIKESNIESPVTDPTAPYTPKDGNYGKMYIKNGYFYVPRFQSGNTNTYSGRSGSKGTGESGLNEEFWKMLEAFFKAAEAEGHKISVDSGGGWRSYEAQVSCAKNNPNCARNPGISIHGWGLAADLKYKNSASSKWAHSNASKYGFDFILKSEPWHIEPKNLKKY